MSPFSSKSTKGPKRSAKPQKKQSKLRGELQSRGMSEEDLDGRGEIDDIASDLSDDERSQVLDFLMDDKSSRRRPSRSAPDDSKGKKQGSPKQEPKTKE